MSFDYKKKHNGSSGDSHGGNFWTSYADLFMMMSMVFLLLYVTASLKAQTSGFQKAQENQKLAERAADLEQQIQVYNTLRDQQLKQESESEQEVYKKLMGKLTLLQDQAHQEKNELRKKAQENEEKEYALNEYQRMIRNIVNTNILAKSQIKRRDVNIKEQKNVIALQDNTIKVLHEDIDDKQETIDENKQKIAQINSSLNQKVKALNDEAKRHAISKQKAAQQIAKLREDSEKKVDALEATNQLAYQELNQKRSELSQAQAALETEKKTGAAEKAQLLSQLTETQKKNEAEMRKAREAFNAESASQRAAFDGELAKERLSGMEKARRIADFANQAKEREAQFQEQIGGLAAKMKDAEGKIADAKGALAAAQAQAAAEKGRLQGAIGSLEGKNAALSAQAQGLAEQNRGLASANQNLSKDLKRAQELADARKNLAKQIKGELGKAGIDGDVDIQTGDVMISFGDEYFDTGSSDLKPNMKKILEKFMPGYSKSLFQNGKIAENIENVEIIGFASSTYKGKYVPPDSLDPKDQEALRYNLKLSTSRATAIFQYAFDTQKMQFPYQRDLLSKVKVVGQGYLPNGKSARDFPRDLPEKEFCKKFNCRNAQRVVVKFKLKD